MVPQGEHAPDFTLDRHDGGSFTLSKEVAASPIVLFFYPRDFTPICTAEACMFRDMHAQLAGSGLRVFGVSPQTVAEHQRFVSTYQLSYFLLSDPTRKVISAYAGRMFGIRIPGFTRRVTYLIDRNMMVVERITADLSATAHGRILAAARKSGSASVQSD